MATATLVRVWKDANYAYAAAEVAVGVDNPGSAVEYIGQTPLVDAQGNPKSLAQIRSDLIAALQQARASSLGSTPTSVNITGSISI